MKVLSLLIVLLCVGCYSCGTSNQEPNIREEPGANDCPAFCNKVVELSKVDLKCTDYLLDAPNNSPNLCIEWCVNAQKNSVQLNPGCMAKVSSCSQIDCASRIAVDQCTNLDKSCPVK